MRESGFAAKRGQTIDASIVSIPKQRNSREENTIIKHGHTPEGGMNPSSGKKY